MGNDLKVLSIDLTKTILMSVSESGECLPMSLLNHPPVDPPPSGRGLVMYVDGAKLKLAAWDGYQWVTT
jgi:hypothetical protein